MNLIKTVVIFPIKIYQRLISPLFPPKCRYQPTCSHYMIHAIEEWGIIRGVWLGTKRIARCHPWGGLGWDPVPPKKQP